MKIKYYKSILEILLVSTKLGLTSFGGPIAHLGYFHAEYVRKRKWLDEKSFADLVALCHFLPGPASSQVGIGIGVMRAGLLGGIISFIGFTMPSVIALILFAIYLQTNALVSTGWLHGLKLVAVAIVAHAILGMAKKLTPDLKTKAIALAALAGSILWKSEFTQISLIILSGILGVYLFKQKPEQNEIKINIQITRKLALICIILFFSLLFILPLMNLITDSRWIEILDRFYRAGALVFGGGHVVLPLLEREVQEIGAISNEAFLAGYGATQAVPGPLFTFAAYLGTVINGWKDGLLATFSIFLPAFLLIIGSLPFWNSLKQNLNIYRALIGVNATVIGILAAAFYNPIWISSILQPIDFLFALILFIMLTHWQLPPWMIVISGLLGGVLFY